MNGLEFLYETVVGRGILKLLVSPWLSKSVGHLMDSRISKVFIKSFVQKNGIDLGECEKTEFSCFNDCFTRQLKKELRPVDMEPSHLISTCDGLLSVWPINRDTVIPVKQSRYTIADLLKDEEMAERFTDGICLVFRLCVNHYHRYCYLDNGRKGNNRFIGGKLHTVRPLALRRYPVFVENCREVTLMETDNFGSVAQIEVGAMLVGKIKNHHEAGTILRGEEKGLFLYGGSTIVVLLEKDAAKLEPEIIKYLQENEEAKSDSKDEEIKEYPVKFGQKIGTKLVL